MLPLQPKRWCAGQGWHVLLFTSSRWGLHSSQLSKAWFLPRTGCRLLLTTWVLGCALAAGVGALSWAFVISQTEAGLCDGAVVAERQAPFKAFTALWAGLRITMQPYSGGSSMGSLL